MANELFGKKKIVTGIRTKLACTWDEAVAYYNAVFETVLDAADAGEAVRVPGLGVVRRAVLEAGEARNPANGETVQVGERYKYTLKSKPKAVVAGQVVEAVEAAV